MITKDRLVAGIQKHFWNSENWFSKERRSNEYWADCAIRVRSPTWIAFHLCTYDPMHLRAAFPACFSRNRQDHGEDDGGAFVRDVLTRHFVKLLAPEKKDGRRVDDGVDSMACFHLNNRVLHPLVNVDAKVDTGHGHAVSVADLLVRRARELRRFDLIVKTSDDLTVCVSGSYDDVVGWLAQTVSP